MLSKTKALTGYTLKSLDGEIGTVKEFYFDDQHWTIRHLVIDTRNWLPGKKVLISPLWIDHVSWHDSKVFVNLSREAIMQSPEYTDWSVLTREFEDYLYQHYKRPGYWVVEPATKK
jgi:hypothetical protein